MKREHPRTRKHSDAHTFSYTHVCLQTLRHTEIRREREGEKEGGKEGREGGREGREEEK